MTKPRKRRSSILKESNEQTQDLANVTFPIRKKRVSWAPKEHDVRFFAKDSPDQNTPEGRGSDGVQSCKFGNVAASSSFAFETLEEESFKMQRAEKQDRNGMGKDNNASMMMNLTCLDSNDDTLTDEIIQQSSSIADVTAFDNSQMEMTCVQDTSTASLSFLDDVSETTCVEQASFVSSGKDSFEESSPPTNVAASVLPSSLFQRNDDKTTCSVKSMDETNIFQPNGRKLNQCDDNSFTLAPTSPMGRKSFGDATTYSCVAMNETNVVSEKMAGGDADELAFLETVVGGMEVDEELASQGSEQQYCIGPASMAEVSSSANTSTLKPAQEPSPMKMLESVDIKSPAKTPVGKESLDSSKTSAVPSNIKSPAKTPVGKESPSPSKTSVPMDVSVKESPAKTPVRKESLDSSKTSVPMDVSVKESPAKTPVRKESLDSSKTSVPMDVSVKESPAKTPVRKESLDSSKTSVVQSNIKSPAKTPVGKEPLDSSKTSAVQSNIKSPAKTPVGKESLDSSKTSVVSSNIKSPAKTPVRKESLDSSKTSVPMDVSVKESPAKTPVRKESLDSSKTSAVQSNIKSPAKTSVGKESLDSSKTSVVSSNIKSPANCGLSTSLKWGQTANESCNSIHPKQGIASSPLSMSTMNFSCSDLMVQSFSCSMNEDLSQPQVSSKVDVDTFFGSIAPELSLLVTNWDENLTEDLISNAENLIENSLEEKVFTKISGYLLEEINKMKLEISALKERFNEKNPEIVNEYRFNQKDETKQKLKEIVFQCKDKTKDYMKQIEEKLREISSSTVNNELFAQIEPFVDEMESKLPNLQSLCDDLMKEVDNERKDIEERMKKIWGDRTPPSKDELEKAFHLLTCIENLRKGNAEIKENEEQWNYLMKRQKRLLDEYNQFSTLMENEEKHRKMILDKVNHNEYQLCDVVEKSRTKWVHSYMKNSLIFTATFDQENPSIVTEYSLKSNIKDNYSVPECDIKLYELAHEIVKYKMDFTAPPSYPVSLREKILISTQVEVNVSRAIELQESVIQSSIEYMGKIKLTWKESDVIEARIKGFNILKRLIIRFTFVERSETGRVKSANFLPISFKIVQNNTNVSESFVSELLKEATSREHIDPTLFRRLILHKLHLECTKSTNP